MVGNAELTQYTDPKFPGYAIESTAPPTPVSPTQGEPLAPEVNMHPVAELKSSEVHKVPVFTPAAVVIVADPPVHFAVEPAALVSTQLPPPIVPVGMVEYGPLAPVPEVVNEAVGLPLDRVTDTDAANGFGAPIVTNGTVVYPDPLLVIVIPLTTPEVVLAVAVACVVPSAEAMTPYCLHDPCPGIPTTPPKTAGVEQYFPRLLRVTDPSSTPTILISELATAVSYINFAPHWTGPGMPVILVEYENAAVADKVTADIPLQAQLS